MRGSSRAAGDEVGLAQMFFHLIHRKRSPFPYQGKAWEVRGREMDRGWRAVVGASPYGFCIPL